MVGTMMSLWPFTTSVGWVMALSSANLSPRGWRHSVIAARLRRHRLCRGRYVDVFLPRMRRAQNILPADWLLSDGRKNR